MIRHCHIPGYTTCARFMHFVESIKIKEKSHDFFLFFSFSVPSLDSYHQHYRGRLSGGGLARYQSETGGSLCLSLDSCWSYCRLPRASSITSTIHSHAGRKRCWNISDSPLYSQCRRIDALNASCLASSHHCTPADWHILITLQYGCH